MERSRKYNWLKNNDQLNQLCQTASKTFHTLVRKKKSPSHVASKYTRNGRRREIVLPGSFLTHVLIKLALDKEGDRNWRRNNVLQDSLSLLGEFDNSEQIICPHASDLIFWLYKRCRWWKPKQKTLFFKGILVIFSHFFFFFVFEVISQIWSDLICLLWECKDVGEVRQNSLVTWSI